jgi:uncharacterized protein YcfL
MKKTILAIFATVALVSCGGVQQEGSKVDSLEVVDSVKVDSSLTASDSTVAEIPTEGVGGGATHEQPIK